MTAIPIPAGVPDGATGSPGALRASDAEREAVAARLRTAAAEGRLTLAEADERQAAAYAARTRDELVPLTADLPAPHPAPAAPRPTTGPLTPAARRRFAVHAAVAAVLAGFLVTAWALDPAPFFWPVWPLFWLGLSLVVHHRRARRVPAAEGP
jgi:ferric-dicitrate binding protein FerR (iron transport regulator)